MFLAWLYLRPMLSLGRIAMSELPFDLIKIDQSGHPLWLCATETREEARQKARLEHSMDPHSQFRLLNSLTGHLEPLAPADPSD
jgi:hypothetical protein